MSHSPAHASEKKVVIIGGTLYAKNMGVTAITLGAIKILSKKIKEKNITIIHSFVESIYPQCTCSFQINDINVVVDEERQGVMTMVLHFLKIIRRLFFSFLWRIFSIFKMNLNIFKHDRVLRSYANSDIVINLSYGDQFAFIKNNALYSLILFASLSINCLIVILLKKPLVFLSQSIGPFENTITRLVAIFILNRSHSIVTREKITKNYLQKTGVKKDILLNLDLAFLVEPISRERVKNIIFHEDVNEIIRDSDTHIIGISLRKISRQAPKFRLENIVQVIDYIHETIKGSIIILIPHDSSSKQDNDPRQIAEKVVLRIKNPSRVIQVKGKYTMEELKGIISYCELFIGLYMHSNIAALSTCVPTIAVGYSHKTMGIMTLLNMKEYVWDARYMEYEQLIEKINNAWKNRLLIRKNLKSRVNILKESTSFSIERLIEEIITRKNKL